MERGMDGDGAGPLLQAGWGPPRHHCRVAAEHGAAGTSGDARDHPLAASAAVNRSHRAPKVPLPPGAADCHMHVFGPYERFPLAPERAYNVPEAPLEEHERMKRAVGLE